MNKDIVSSKTFIAFIHRNGDAATITICNIGDVAGKSVNVFETSSRGARKAAIRELERMENE